MFEGLLDLVKKAFQGASNTVSSFTQPAIRSIQQAPRQIQQTISHPQKSLSDLVQGVKKTITNPQTYRNIAATGAQQLMTAGLPQYPTKGLPRLSLPNQKNPVAKFVLKDLPEDIVNQFPSSVESTGKIQSSVPNIIRGAKPEIKSVQQAVGETANALLAPLSFVGGGEAATVAKSVGKQALKKVLITGAKQGAKIGAGYGAVQGVAQDREKPKITFKDQAINSALNALMGGTAGVVVGAGGAGAAQKIKNALTPEAKTAVEELVAQAEKAKPRFDKIVNQALKDLDVTINHGNVKRADRISQKIAMDYKNSKNPLGEIKDAIRSAVVADSPGKLDEIVGRLQRFFPNLEVKPINNRTGYKANKILIDLGNGLKSEIQVVSPEMWAAKKELGGQALYKQYRVSKSKGEYAALKKVYSDAADAEARRLNSSSVISEPSNAFATAKGSPSAVEPTISSPSSVSLTGVPSQSKNLGKVSSIEQSIADENAALNGGAFGDKERKFITTVKDSPKTPQEVKDKISSYYNVRPNQQTLYEADNIINTNIDDAIKLAKEGPSTAVNNAVGLRLIDKYIGEGNYNQAIDLVESLAKKVTSQGQAIQILSLYNRLTPEGAIRYAQRLVDRSNEGKTSGFTKVGEAAAKRIAQLAEKVQQMPDGDEKMVATAELVEEIQSVVPSSMLQKVSTIQTMAQLLNPKTAIRNVVGNAGFVVGENISDVVAAPVDAVLSLITGKRTKVLPNPLVQAKGFATGLKQGVIEAIKRVNTQPNITSQFDLPQTRTFSNPIGAFFEKALNLELRAPDRAFYRAAFENSLDQQMRIAGVTEPTQAMLEVAHFDGLYRTFQDETVTTKIFSGLKRALNVGKDFGLGDLILKYPKTPAALIARGIDYSPAGFANMVMKMGQPLFGRPFDQKGFVESFSRALVGTTGLITTGVLLHKLGIVTGRPEKDRDISAVQRVTGMGGYKLNTDALKRFIASGFDASVAKPQEGDNLITYDWFQPFAIGVSMGANIDENNGKVASGGQVATILDSLQGGVETLYEQPLIKGFRQLFQGYDPMQALVTTLESTPSSFVPSILNQYAQFTGDNISRNTYDKNPIKEALNMAANRIPGAVDQLPIYRDVYGNPSERYQNDSNNLFNVFFNPAFVSTLQEDPSSKEVLDIFQNSGETQQAPRIVPKKVTVNGKDLELTADEQSIYQEYVGKTTKGVYDQLIQDPKFAQLPDEDKAKTMASYLTDINTAAKILLFGHRPDRVDKSVKNILRGEVDFSGIKSTAEKDYAKLIGKSGGGARKIKIKPPAKPSPNSGKTAKIRITKSKPATARKVKLSLSSGVGNSLFKAPKVRITTKRPTIQYPNAI